MTQQSHSGAYIQKKTLIQKDTCTPVHSSTVYNSQGVEAA